LDKLKLAIDIKLQAYKDRMRLMVISADDEKKEFIKIIHTMVIIECTDIEVAICE